MGKRSPKALRAALNSLSSGSDAYHSAYKDTMERIQGQLQDQEELAKQALSWICFAERHLTSTELQSALAIEEGTSDLDKDNIPEIEDIVSACAGLVVVDEESGIIRLVHYTTQEYFEKTREEWFPNAEADIAVSCTRYLSFEEFKKGQTNDNVSFGERMRAYPLFIYAARHWGNHVRKASLSSQELVDLVTNEGSLESMAQVLLSYADGMFFQLSLTGFDSLHLAARHGTCELLTRLLAELPQPITGLNSFDPLQLSPLHYAAQEGHSVALKILLENGADINLLNRSGDSPLWLAVHHGQAQITKILIDNGADIEISHPISGKTPLVHVCQRGYIDVAKILLDAGADLHARGNTLFSLSILNAAQAYGHIDLAIMLIDRGADVGSRGSRSPLNAACEGGHLNLVKKLLAAGANANPSNNLKMPLHCAVKADRRDDRHLIVEQLLAKGADINAQEGTTGRVCLYLAVIDNDIPMLKLLLHHGARLDIPDSHGRLPLHWATENCSKEAAQFLLDQGLSPNSQDKDGVSPLSMSAQNEGKVTAKNYDLISQLPTTSHRGEGYGHRSLVPLFLAHGATVDMPAENGRTALSWAAGYGDFVADNTLALLAHGAKLDIPDHEGRTPLSWAAQYGHMLAVKNLLAHGAAVDQPDHSGRTPLSWASCYDHDVDHVTVMLLENGAAIDTVDHVGQTPLSLAARYYNLNIAATLLRYGADPKIKDSTGRYPVDWTLQQLEEGDEDDFRDVYAVFNEG